MSSKSQSKAKSMPEHKLVVFMAVGDVLSRQMAQETFDAITSRRGWTEAAVAVATEIALLSMEKAARRVLVEHGGDPDGDQWQELWKALEKNYRFVMAGLLRKKCEQASHDRI